MARAKLSPLANHVHGKVGQVVFRETAGRTVVQNAPAKSTKPRTPKQRTQQGKFKLAAAYAKVALRDPQARPVYDQRYKRKRRQHKLDSLFSLAVADYLRPPVVTEVQLKRYRGRPGDVIKVDACDDTYVARVTVTIRTSDGEIVEAGDAQMVKGEWVYRATVAVPPGTCPLVTATAYDLPGHTGELTMALNEEGLPIGPLVWVAEEVEGPAEPAQPAAEEYAPTAATDGVILEPAAAAAGPAYMPAVEAPAALEEPPPAPAEPAWYWVPAWPVPASTATALVAMPGKAEADMALPGLWSAPDYAGWPAEPVSLPCEVEA